MGRQRRRGPRDPRLKENEGLEAESLGKSAPDRLPPTKALFTRVWSRLSHAPRTEASKPPAFRNYPKFEPGARLMFSNVLGQLLIPSTSRRPTFFDLSPSQALGEIVHQKPLWVGHHLVLRRECMSGGTRRCCETPECTGICLITPPDKLSRGVYTLVVSEIHWVHSVLDISASGVLQVREAPMCHADSAPHSPSPEFAAKMTTYDWSKVTKADPKHYQTCPRLDFQTVSKRRSVGNGSSVSMGELAFFFI